MNNIDIFYNSEIIFRKQSFKIRYYIYFMLVLIIELIIFSCFFKYNSYNKFKAVILKNSNDYYLKILVAEEDLANINTNILIINNKEYIYKIKNISSDYVLDETFNKYYEVLLELKIEPKLVINNNIIDIKIKGIKTTFIKEVIKKIKRGMR